MNAASIDGCAGFSSSMTSPSTSSFSNWPRGGSLMKNAQPGDERGRDAEDEERPAPALGAAGRWSANVAMRPTSSGLRVAEHLLAEVHDRRHPGADADRVVVGDQRRVHRDVVGLGDAGRGRCIQNNMNALSAAPVRNVNAGAEQARDADDRHALHAVGEPAERDRAEREEQARRGADEHDGARC